MDTQPFPDLLAYYMQGGGSNNNTAVPIGNRMIQNSTA